MQKIPTIFLRDFTNRGKITQEWDSRCLWVREGEGVATRKWDGSCCLVSDGKLYKRYEVKRGRTPPSNFEASGELDEKTGKQQGWVPVGVGPDDRWHLQAWEFYEGNPVAGTYELIGPKVNGNREGCHSHDLVPHGKDILFEMPCEYETLAEYLANHNIEGIVWHHPDGRMAKIKRRDFGLKW